MSPEPDDAAVERFISEHPGGAPFHEIGEFMGLTHQRVQQIVNRAVAKCLRRLAERKIHNVTDVIPERFYHPLSPE